MADFCKQCSEAMFGEDFGDLKGLITEGLSKQGFVVDVICEGCGFTVVNHEGKCVNPECAGFMGKEKHAEN